MQLGLTLFVLGNLIIIMTRRRRRRRRIIIMIMIMIIIIIITNKNVYFWWLVQLTSPRSELRKARSLLIHPGGNSRSDTSGPQDVAFRQQAHTEAAATTLINHVTRAVSVRIWVTEAEDYFYYHYHSLSLFTSHHIIAFYYSILCLIPLGMS